MGKGKNFGDILFLLCRSDDRSNVSSAHLQFPCCTFFHCRLQTGELPERISGAAGSSSVTCEVLPGIMGLNARHSLFRGKLVYTYLEASYHLDRPKMISVRKMKRSGLDMVNLGVSQIFIKTIIS